MSHLVEAAVKRTRPGKRSAAPLRLLLAGLAACVGLMCGQRARAQNVAPELSQYAHTAWKVRDGFAKGTIMAVAQTPDGYLWLGTTFGLYRFDGVRAVPWQPPAGQQLPGDRISDLLLAQDGTLWISTFKGLASWKDGQLANYPELAGQMVGALLQDREGTIWVVLENPGRLCAVQNGKVQCYGQGSFGTVLYIPYEDRKGNLWVAGETGLWRWKPGNPEHYALPGIHVEHITEADDGELLLGTREGLKKLAGGRIQNYALPGITGRFRFDRFFRASDGSLWIGSPQGLLRLRQGRTETFGAADGLSGDSVMRIFEDTEGNLWVATLGGLDRFREYAVATVSPRQGLSSSDVWSVQATSDGRIWMGTSNGLNRSSNGDVTVYGRQTSPEETARAAAPPHAEGGLARTAHGLGLDNQGRLCVSTFDGVFYFDGNRFVRIPGVTASNIWSIAGDGHGKLWMNDGTAGLFYLTPGEAAQPIPWSRFGQKGFGPEAILPDRANGGIWLGFWEGGVAYFKDGQVRASYTTADGLGSGLVGQLRFGSRGTLWAATEGGLSRIRDGRVLTLTSKNGLPCDKVLWSMEDDDHAVWLYMSCGLVRIARSELDAWVSDPGRKLRLATFDNSDGVQSVETYSGFAPHVTKAPDGKIWFGTYGDGVSVIDPHHLPYNKVPPPVHIEQLTADGKTYDAASSNDKGTLRLPPLVRNLTIDYTALSLVLPEKVRFRFKLEGQDKDWREVTNKRQVEYSNLRPKKYRFRVMASNNSGVWNETGAFLDFSIAPAYYQTIWFRALCVAAFLALLWALYQYRLHQIQREFNAGLEARVNERLRIARELHDTLLQSFQGLLLRFQTATNLLPARPEEAKQKFESAIDFAAQAITEGRDAVQGLRSSATLTNELAAALDALAKELAGNGTNGDSPVFAVAIEGEPRDLHPILRDEVYRIAGEAMRNAFRHAHAKRIEVEIHYDVSHLRLRIRDDGKGIESDVVKGDGRAGHFGLNGMRERAKLIGGNLEVWSSAQSGTEIELTIPASAAYAAARTSRGS